MDREKGREEGLSRRLMRAVEEEFMTLNPQQRAAAMHGEGRALCIAGPGSGKTAVISRRAARLGLVCGGGPMRGRVLTLAFNRAACREMRDRGEDIVRRVCGRAGADVDAALMKTDYYTIHGYCFRVVRDHCAGRGMPVPRVQSPEEENALIREAFFEVSGGRAGDEMLSLFKNYNIRENGVTLPAGDYNVLFRLVRERYSAMKQKIGVVDFGDMLELAALYLRRDAEFRRSVVSAYDYVQVDEAQDLSGMQADIVGLISSRNVFFVADDDQSIYGFRGSDPEVVRRLGEGAAIYMLERNYRSKSEITETASLFIKGNIRRFSKNLTADKGRGGRVAIRAFKDEVSQGMFAVRKILECRRKGRTVCVLYRNNAGAAVVLTLLYFAGGASGNGRCSVAGQCGKQTVGAPEASGVRITGERTKLSEIPYTALLTGAIKRAEEEEAKRTENRPFANVPLPGTIYRRLEKSGFTDVIGAETMAGRRKFYVENVKAALKIIVGNSRTAGEILLHAAAIDEFGDARDGTGVFMSTIHSAKGLEYDTVIIIDCVKGEIPFGSPSGDALSEERRLMYVAMTRAGSELYVTYPRRCGKLEFMPGEFLDELKEVLGDR